MESGFTIGGCNRMGTRNISHRDRRYALHHKLVFNPSLTGWIQFFLIFEVGYCAAIIPIKMSISFMLIRVAEGRKLYIYIQYAVMAVFVAMNFIALIFILTNCIPIA